MPDLKSIRNDVQDRVSAASKRAQARASARKPRNAARRKIVFKALAVGFLIAAFAVLALMVGSADYEATPIGWIPLIMLVAAIASSWVYLRILKWGIAFEETSLVNDCRRDEEVQFNLHFANRSILYAYRLDVSFFISDLEGNTANRNAMTLALSPRESYDLSLSARFEHIGAYQAGLERIVISDFLGLFTATIVNHRRHTVHVAPKIISITNMDFSDDAEVETDKALKAILAPSMDYAYVRDYEPGDPLKTIHWKLSARSDEYMTKLFEVYTNPGVAVVVNLYSPSDDILETMTMFDCVVESGFTVADFARSQGLDTELHFRDKYGDDRKITAWKKGELSRVVDEMPPMARDDGLRQAGLDIIANLSKAQRGQNNLVVCSADLSADAISAVIAAKVQSRTPFFIAVVPAGMNERERQKWCKNLARLDTAGISYSTVSYADDLAGASL